MSKRKSFKHIINHKNTSSNGHGKLILLSVDCWSYFWWDAWRCVVTLHSYKFSIPEKCWILRFFGNVTPFRMFKRQIIYKYVGYGYRIAYDILNKCWAKKSAIVNLWGSLGIRTDYHELPQDDSPRGKIGFKAQCSSSQIWLNNVEHNRIYQPNPANMWKHQR
jgi:hypothetical protein